LCLQLLYGRDDDPTVKRVLTAISAALLLLPAGAALADEVYPIVFPVDGPHHYTDTFGVSRGGDRTHEGIDIIAAKMTPVVAAADGTVGWVSDQCCAMELVHDDGYRSRYIHLNNDTPGTDDGLGWGFAPGIESGTRVEARQLIGYVGDSGNAEATSPHLHFELRYSSGVAFNPYESLLVAIPPDADGVTWHVGAISDGRLSVQTSELTVPFRHDSGIATFGDFDGDGSDESAVGGGYDPGWVVSDLDGNARDWSATDGAGARSVLVGDFDGDGDDDMAAFFASRTWSGYRSNGSSFDDESWGRFGGRGWGTQLVGDYDGDGKDEILSFHPDTRNWWISELVGDGLRSSVFAAYGTSSGWLVHFGADVDGDGAEELLSFHPSNGTWWASGKGENPRLVYDVTTNSGWQHLTSGDLDQDGTDELIMFHPSNGTWWVVDPSTAPARLSLWGRFSTRTGWVNPVTADINGDGSDDIVIRHQPTGRVWGMLGSTPGRLIFLGDLVAGTTEGDWLVRHPATGLGLVALTLD
jgi:hypothetical protein